MRHAGAGAQPGPQRALEAEVCVEKVDVEHDGEHDLAEAEDEVDAAAIGEDELGGEGEGLHGGDRELVFSPTLQFGGIGPASLCVSTPHTNQL